MDGIEASAKQRPTLRRFKQKALSPGTALPGVLCLTWIIITEVRMNVASRSSEASQLTLAITRGATRKMAGPSALQHGPTAAKGELK